MGTICDKMFNFNHPQSTLQNQGDKNQNQQKLESINLMDQSSKYTENNNQDTSFAKDSQLSSNTNKIIKNKDPYSDYKKLATIGQGAYGQVLLIKRRKDGNLFAMKVIRKEKVSKNEKIIEATLLEKKILMKSKHPFIVKMHKSFQTERKLYIIMEYMPQGDLYSVLQKAKKFDENTARFIFAEVILGIQYLHEVQKSMYRDLKPENILIEETGHIKLSDFGLAKEFINKEDKENSFLGTPQYLAPEIVLQQPYDKNIDLWTLGILLFELLCGRPPFGVGGQKTLYREIAMNKPRFPEFFSENAVDIIKQLLQSIPQKRLGSEGFEQLKTHPFFEKIDWAMIYSKQLESPLKQYLALKKFDKEIRETEIVESPKNTMQKSQSRQQLYGIFPNFTYNPGSLMLEN